MKFKTKTALAVVSLIASVSAFAQAKPATPDYTLAYNVGVVSDYRFRGIEQTAGGPSFQGGIDFTHKSGFYAGAFFAEGIKWIKEFNGADAGTYEIDLFAGYKGALSKSMGIGFDVGAITYMYPGNTSGKVGTRGQINAAGSYTNADTTEFFAGLTYGPASLKMYQSVGDFLGNTNTNASRYFDLSASFDLGSGFTLTPHYGYQTLPTNSTSNATNTANYSDYSLTVAKDFGNGVVVSLAAIGTDAKKAFYTTGGWSENPNRFLGKDTVVLGLKYNF